MLEVEYRVDDIVWVQLGVSYGWWPAQVQEGNNQARLSPSLLQTLGPEFGDDLDQETPQHGDVIHVRFFDDDCQEWLKVSEGNRLKNYSCKDKRKLITAGFKKLDEGSKGSSALGGVNLRLAQFYKDVELAEVLTDNDPQVGNILAQYEVSETEEIQAEVSQDQRQHSNQSECSVSEPVTNERAEKSNGKKKPVLREIKNGRISKQKKGRRKKNR